MDDSLKTLPKAEVHVHLEGSLDIDEVVALAQSAGTSLPRPRDQLLAFSGLTDFLHFLDWMCGVYETPDQISAAAYSFARRMQRSGAQYADIIVNPTHWPHWRRNLSGFISALDSGFAAAEHDGLPPVGLCVSLLRQQSADEAIELVEALTANRHPRVVALSVDGNEKLAGRTGPRFSDAFRRAGAKGLKRTVHAGEVQRTRRRARCHRVSWRGPNRSWGKGGRRQRRGSATRGTADSPRRLSHLKSDARPL